MLYPEHPYMLRQMLNEISINGVTGWPINIELERNVNE